jgi:chemotaxis protein methyltransferase CheR
MSFDSEGLGLPTGPLGLIRSLIHERTGVFFDDARCDTLADRLAPRVIECGFDSLLDYYYLLKYDERASDEWGSVMDALAVPETYFWREIEQLQVIAQMVVPRVLAAKPRAIVWSVPCASGEEPLTLAMLLDRAGLLAGGRVSLRAADASPAAVRAAQRGTYRERSFRALPSDMRDRYFTREAELSRVDRSLVDRIEWSTMNLMSDMDTLQLAGADVIVCRNVFIYFSDASMKKVVETFTERMSTPGYLAVGASESLLRVTRRFDLEEIGGSFLYVKR